MSGLGTGIRTFGESVRGWVLEGVDRTRRTTPGPALVRVIAGLAALGGFVLALPPQTSVPTYVGAVVPLAVVVGLFPRGRWVGVAALLMVAAWLVTTIAYEAGPVQPWRVGALAGALYVMHTAAALAAVLPYDSIVSAGMVARWAIRSLLVLLASAGLGLIGMVVLSQLRPVQSIIGPVVGSVVAAGLVGLLAWHLRRRA
jgi:hypothetical protein